MKGFEPCHTILEETNVRISLLSWSFICCRCSLYIVGTR